MRSRATRIAPEPFGVIAQTIGFAAIVGSTLLAAPRHASAIEYEIFVDVADDEELYDLFTTGQLSEQSFQDLQDLLRRGVDLNRAAREDLYALPNLTYGEVDRILAYRDEAGTIPDPVALVAAGVLSERKLRSIAAFILVPDPDGKRTGVRGHVRYQTIWTSEDRRVPPMALDARMSTLRDLSLGGAVLLDRNTLAPVTYDPNRDGLITDGQKTQVRPVKYFAVWDTPNWGVIAGTYMIGFGQRLTFDTSGRYTPNGFFLDNTINRQSDLTKACRETTGELTETPCPTGEPNRYVTPDYDFREGLRGVAAGFRHVALPKGWLQGYAFFSFQTRSIYQYELYRPDRCDDPHRDGADDDECKAPPVYTRPSGDPLTSSSEVAYSTLPNMYNEILGGGNFSYFLDRRTHLGITGYGAATQWLVDGIDLDFQDHARPPYGGPFGAIGADLSWGRSWSDLFVEFTQSFDHSKPGGGGGPAGIVRHVASWRSHEIETSARYYHPRFSNPYARAIAAADEVDGLRARAEAGGRIRYNGTILERLGLRTAVDVWTTLNDDNTHLSAYVRGDVQATRWFRPGLWVDYQNRDLTRNGREECYLGVEDTYSDISGKEIVERCHGEQVQLTARMRFDPHERVNVSLQYRHQFVDADGGTEVVYSDDERGDDVIDAGQFEQAVDYYETHFRQDNSAFVMLNTRPIDPLALRFRVTWVSDELRFDDRGEQSLWLYLQIQYRIRRWFVPSVRYDLRQWLDQRDSTALRRPNPEHWVYFTLESRF